METAIEESDPPIVTKRPTLRAKYSAIIWSYCQVFLQENHPEPEQDKIIEKFKYALLCPPHGRMSFLLTFFVLSSTTGIGLYSLLSHYPGLLHKTMSLYSILVFPLVGGYLAKYARMPGLLGMLLVGIIMRNIPYFDIYSHVDMAWQARLRWVCVVVMLSRSGVTLSKFSMENLWMLIFRLGTVPCIVEGSLIGLIVRGILGIPWMWCFILGFSLSGNAPNIIFPCLKKMNANGFGLIKGISIIDIAASHIDNLVSYTLFGVLLGLSIPREGILGYKLSNVIISSFAGIFYGLPLGLFIRYFPEKASPSAGILRLAIVLTLNTTAVVGSINLGIPAAGAVASVALTYIACHKWRREENYDDMVTRGLDHLWYILEPCLFGLIGIQIPISYLDGGVVGYAILIIILGVIVKMGTSYLVMMGTVLNHNEKVFIAITSLPKATIQAALGAMPLDILIKKKFEGEVVEVAETLLIFAVLSILITAPLGAVLINVFGPRLLPKETMVLGNLTNAVTIVEHQIEMIDRKCYEQEVDLNDEK